MSYFFKINHHPQVPPMRVICTFATKEEARREMLAMYRRHCRGIKGAYVRVYDRDPDDWVRCFLDERLDPIMQTPRRPN